MKLAIAIYLILGFLVISGCILYWYFRLYRVVQIKVKWKMLPVALVFWLPLVIYFLGDSLFGKYFNNRD